ncbi:MAG: 3-deoxy-manno-octulosonate cytidylyltransferase [bacterium]|nr:3-deoxy-manno-octulosonate cytidylyltransferase [bacterium]
MTAVGIIPACYASQRFPGKPLADILGKPMIQWVYEQASATKRLRQVLVATDDERIYQTVATFGGNVEMTSPAAANGTERIAEIARRLDDPLIVNIQGDEPLIRPDVIDQLVELMVQNPQAPVGTLVTKIADDGVPADPNVVKVVLDKYQFAIYFSRFPIPYRRGKIIGDFPYYQHIGIYIYRREFLLELVKLPQLPLENAEQLEQLRILEHGFKIKAALTDVNSLGVDVPEDIEKVKSFMMENSL